MVSYELMGMSPVQGVAHSFAQMLQEDPLDLGDAHRVLVGPVMARYYKFALRPVKVAAPIRNKAIVAHRWLVAEVASFAPVAKDGMVGYPLRQGQVRQGRDEAVFGIEKIDAVGHLLELFACGIRLRQAEGFGVARQHIAGTADYY